MPDFPIPGTERTPTRASGSTIATFPVPISELSERRVEWLERHGRGRYQGWCLDANGCFAVDVARLDGRGSKRFLGDDLDDALGNACADVRAEVAAP